MGNIASPCVATGTSAPTVQKLLNQAEKVLTTLVAAGAANPGCRLVPVTIPPFPTDDEINLLGKDDTDAFVSVLKYLRASSSTGSPEQLRQYPQADVTHDKMEALAERLTLFDGLKDDAILLEQLLDYFAYCLRYLGHRRTLLDSFAY
jgi:hypothetical protein